MKKSALIVALLCMTLSACGKDGSDIDGSGDGLNDPTFGGRTEEFSYQYNFNGCDTGKQSFSSKSAYCAGLLNDELNHGCARSMREQAHRDRCS